ncbi:helix-turn-helix transcriptional regulator [Phenylobacterium sp.]|jgi:transcriptional regulator with XRE-family HTH domain|uniref:helix-turn-helix domain-containing protein n=1 Tax=Phenylobacterium sp. TaxID=1871053 RepID=UPI002F3FBC03
MLTPLQIKLARTALGLGLRDLAAAAGVAPSTITRFETAKGGMQTGTLERIQKVLEAGGVIFVAADAQGGPGIRMRS